MGVQTINELTAEAVEAFSRARSEPDWMRELRLRAFKRFKELPLPIWDRTDVSALDWGRVRPPAASDAAREAGMADLPEALMRVAASQSDAAAFVLQKDARSNSHFVRDAVKKQGVIATDMETALREHPDLIRRYFMQAVDVGEDKFTALHAALWSGGVFVYVPKNVELELPVQFQLWSGTAGPDLFDHILVVAEANSSLTFIEGAEGEDSAEQRLHCGVVEVFAGDGARIRYGAIQHFGAATFNVTVRRAEIGRDASVEWVLGEFGSQLARINTISLLKGDGSDSKSVMLFFGDLEQHLDLSVIMQHIGAFSTGEMLAKGVVSDRSYVVYRGLTDIQYGAKNASAFQRENTLILSKEARSDAIPGLEIHDNRVQAGHAATVGQIDPLLLFYLMSRGLQRRAAEKLLVDGFFQPLMERIPLAGVRQELQRLIDRKLRA